MVFMKSISVISGFTVKRQTAESSPRVAPPAARLFPSGRVPVRSFFHIFVCIEILLLPCLGVKIQECRKSSLNGTRRKTGRTGESMVFHSSWRSMLLAILIVS